MPQLYVATPLLLAIIQVSRFTRGLLCSFQAVCIPVLGDQATYVHALTYISQHITTICTYNCDLCQDLGKPIPLSSVELTQQR